MNANMSIMNVLSLDDEEHLKMGIFLVEDIQGEYKWTISLVDYLLFQSAMQQKAIEETHKEIIQDIAFLQQNPELQYPLVEVQILCQNLNSKLTSISNSIRNDAKMHAYLQELQITPANLLLNYQEIMQTNTSLVAKSRGNEVVRRGATAYFEMVLALMKEKSIEGLDAKGKIGWYLQLETKLHCCSLELFNVFKPHNDITNSPKEEYQHVWQKIKIVAPERNVHLIKKQYKDLKRVIHAAVSSVLNESQHELSLIRKLRFGISLTKYLIMNDSSKLRSLKYYRSPTLEMTQKIWNISEYGATKTLSRLSFDSVKTKIKIYLPISGELDPNIDIFEERPNTIIIRVLSNTELVKYPGRQQVGCCTSRKQMPTLESAIIYFHGGGYISLSSRSMQNFTRKWANQLGVPILSIDYRMPPDHPFPHAPRDCHTAYRFILDHLHEYLNIRPSKFYFAGDSAGGNMACALLGLILKNKEPMPQGLYLAYPSLDTRKLFTTSRIYALTDPLLWPCSLVLCVDSYHKNENHKASNPLASPLLMTQEYVGGEKGDLRFPLKWPKTLISVGSRDPLLDDSLVLMQRMVSSNIDCQCILYDQLSHGFLNMAGAHDECKRTLANSIDHLRQLMQQGTKN